MNCMLLKLNLPIWEWEYMRFLCMCVHLLPILALDKWVQKVWKVLQYFTKNSYRRGMKITLYLLKLWWHLPYSCFSDKENISCISSRFISVWMFTLEGRKKEVIPYNSSISTWKKFALLKTAVVKQKSKSCQWR